MSESDAKSNPTVPPVVGGETRLLHDDRDPLIGRVIDGKYLVEAVIGAGGMGKVYRGRNQRTDSPVAIKTLLPSLVADETLVKRFEVEAKSASNLRHPNTIRIFDFGQEGELLFMVMELLDGMSLEALLRKERILPPERVLRITAEVCRSLEEAHAAGLVHRDIKPDNIFLNRVGDAGDEHVKVLDFGVAKLRNKQYGGATLTQAGMIFGTPRYMSPEQARAQELDGRSDIYALGVIMYEALTGKAPFVSDDPMATLIMHLNEPVPPFHETNPTLQFDPRFERLEELVMRCLEKTPDKRFDDVRNLLNAIEGFGQGDDFSTGSSTTSAARVDGGRTHLFAENKSGEREARKDAFDAMGVSRTGAGPASRYSMGSTDGQEPQVFEKRSSPVLKIAAGFGAFIALAAVGLFLFIRSDSAPTTPPISASTPPAPVAAIPPVEPEPAAPAARASLAAPVIENARFRMRDAFRSSRDGVLSRLVTIPFRATPEDAPAFARLTETDDEPTALPHTFVFWRDPGSPRVNISFTVTAEGYRDEVKVVPLETPHRAINVELRRRSSGGGSGGSSRNGDSGGRVAIPGGGGNNGGFVNPF